MHRHDTDMPKSRPQRQMELTALRNMPVCSPGGELLGKIEEIVVDVRAGVVDSICLRLAQAPRGRVLRIAIPWSLLQTDDDCSHVELDIALQTLVTVASRRSDKSTHCFGEISSRTPDNDGTT